MLRKMKLVRLLSTITSPINHTRCIELHSASSQDEECTKWKWDTSKTKLWNEDTQRKHGSSQLVKLSLVYGCYFR